MAKDRDRNDESEPQSATRREQSLAGTSYGATEREQTADVRRRSPSADADVADGGVSEELERDSKSPPD